MKKLYITSAAIILGSSAAYAADASDIRLLNESKISLVEAIEAAEDNIGGKAIEASLDDDAWKPAYEVSIVKDNRVFDVQVDATDGKVLGSREDIDD